MRKKGPTIKDVAARAGVSVMAVSRVCNPAAAGQVSTAMREKVMRAIEELGYQPDSVARSLRRRRTDTVGFYNCYRGMVLLDDDFLRGIFNGIQARATELAQDLLIFNAPHKVQPPQQVVEDLGTSRIDGLVFVPEEEGVEMARHLSESYINVVSVGEAIGGLPAITAQDAEGARMLARYLFDRGHRKVLYRHAWSNVQSACRRRDAFLDEADRLGIDIVVTQTTIGNELDAVDNVESEIILGYRDRGITAIVGWHDYSAVKAILFCRDAGIRIPADIAVVGFDRLTPPFCPADVDLTTIEVDWIDVARRAVDYIAKGPEEAARPELGDVVIERNGAVEISVACKLHIGNTS